MTIGLALMTAWSLAATEASPCPVLLWPDAPHVFGWGTAGIADLQADGDPDVLAVGRTGIWALDVWSGTVRHLVVADFLSTDIGFLVADVNGDALPDVIFHVDGGRLAVALGAVQEPLTVFVVDGSESTRWPPPYEEAVDWDEDGFLDVTRGPEIWLGSPEPPHLRLGHVFDGEYYPSPVGDLDLDGHVDYVQADWMKRDGRYGPEYSGPLLLTFRSPVVGPSDPVVVPPLAPGEALGHAVAAADLDASGNLELVALSVQHEEQDHVDGTVVAYQVEGVPAPVGTYPFSLREPQFAALHELSDLDGDGGAELAFVRQEEDHLDVDVLSLADGELEVIGKYEAGTSQAFDDLQVLAHRARVYDVDADGRGDLVGAGFTYWNRRMQVVAWLSLPGPPGDETVCPAPLPSPWPEPEPIPVDSGGLDLSDADDGRGPRLEPGASHWPAERDGSGCGGCAATGGADLGGLTTNVTASALALLVLTLRRRRGPARTLAAHFSSPSRGR